MNFTYKVVYQNQQDRTMTVFYSPEHPKALPTTLVLSYPANATAEELRDIILLSAPVIAWENAAGRNDPPIVMDVTTATIADAKATTLRFQPQLTAADIDAERDRRINAGVTFNGVRIQSRVTDRENISGKSLQAFMAVVNGAQPGNLRWANPDQDFVWIAADNSLIPMDAQTVIALGDAVAAAKEALIFTGRRLKDMNPLPENYKDDQWWPVI